MRVFVATMGRNRRVTIPAEVRQQLGIGESDSIAFVLDVDGSVRLRPARFTLESVPSRLPALPNESLELDREIEEATGEEADQKMRRWRRQ